jgi:hypothetical protein
VKCSGASSTSIRRPLRWLGGKWFRPRFRSQRW